MAYILDDAGFVTGTYDGPDQPANSTNVPPPTGAAIPLQFVNDAWVMAASDHRITYMAFLSRFTSVERGKVRAAQVRDGTVADFLMLAQAAKYIDLTDPRVTGGVAYFASVELITADRVAQILSLDIDDAERP